MALGGAEGLQKWAQAAFAIAGTGAIIVGAVLYFTERRYMPRIVIQPTATVVGLPAPGAEQGRPLGSVLVQITINIENRSTRGSWFNCSALDVIALTGEEERNAAFPDDLLGNSLLPATRSEEVWRNCAEFEAGRQRSEEERRRTRRDPSRVNPPALFGPPATGTRYRDFFMEPGEAITKTWEQRVPCSYRAVRVIFKLPKPDQESWIEYETKMLVPVADVCRGERLVATYSGGGS
ncbi:MAG TPA: hypothetical protein VN231_07400 [Allosphingosinicella sp.]|nr:hypothetical protein [Allosphingosinicella sp.]